MNAIAVCTVTSLLMRAYEVVHRAVADPPQHAEAVGEIVADDAARLASSMGGA